MGTDLRYTARIAQKNGDVARLLNAAIEDSGEVGTCPELELEELPTSKVTLRRVDGDTMIIIEGSPAVVLAVLDGAPLTQQTVETTCLLSRQTLMQGILEHLADGGWEEAPWTSSDGRRRVFHHSHAPDRTAYIDVCGGSASFEFHEKPGRASPISLRLSLSDDRGVRTRVHLHGEDPMASLSSFEGVVNEIVERQLSQIEALG